MKNEIITKVCPPKTYGWYNFSKRAVLQGSIWKSNKKLKNRALEFGPIQKVDMIR